jgi:uncharacterized protein
LLLEDEHGIARANDWAMGFLRGMELRRKTLASLLNDDQNAGSLVPIFALAHECDPDPEMRPYREPPSAEQRDKLIVGAAAGVMRIYHYFETQCLIAKPLFGDTTYRRVGPKVGRNELCPCGSGKKFKQCCRNPSLKGLGCIRMAHGAASHSSSRAGRPDQTKTAHSRLDSALAERLT